MCPAVGRYLSETPGGLAGGNVYRYARSNPVNADRGGDPEAPKVADGKSATASWVAGLLDLGYGNQTGQHVREQLGFEQYVDYHSSSYVSVRRSTGQAVCRTVSGLQRKSAELAG
jgi:hypothetical protein